MTPQASGQTWQAAESSVRVGVRGPPGGPALARLLSKTEQNAGASPVTPRRCPCSRRGRALPSEGAATAPRVDAFRSTKLKSGF
jgi:hypothetical protein